MLVHHELSTQVGDSPLALCSCSCPFSPPRYLHPARPQLTQQQMLLQQQQQLMMMNISGGSFRPGAPGAGVNALFPSAGRWPAAAGATAAAAPFGIGSPAAGGAAGVVQCGGGPMLMPLQQPQPLGTAFASPIANTLPVQVPAGGSLGQTTAATAAATGLMAGVRGGMMLRQGLLQPGGAGGMDTEAATAPMAATAGGGDSPSGHGFPGFDLLQQQGLQAAAPVAAAADRGAAGGERGAARAGRGRGGRRAGSVAPAAQGGGGGGDDAPNSAPSAGVLGGDDATSVFTLPASGPEAVANADSGATAAAAQEQSLSPRPLSEFSLDEVDDWGPDGEAEFMSMLNLAMDEQAREGSAMLTGRDESSGREEEVCM